MENALYKYLFINVQFLAMTQGSVCWFSTLPCEVFFPD